MGKRVHWSSQLRMCTTLRFHAESTTRIRRMVAVMSLYRPKEKQRHTFLITAVTCMERHSVSKICNCLLIVRDVLRTRTMQLVQSTSRDTRASLPRERHARCACTRRGVTTSINTSAGTSIHFVFVLEEIHTRSMIVLTRSSTDSSTARWIWLRLRRRRRWRCPRRK